MVSTALRVRERLVLLLATLLLAVAVVLAALWLQSMIRGASVSRRTTVESGSVIESTGPERITEYISHRRTLSSHVGRLHLTYMRADELAKSARLPRRVTWHAWLSPGRGSDRYDAPEWIAWTGFDWKIREGEGGRPNGEYWSNRDIFIAIPYWLLVVLSGGSGWLIGRRIRLKRRRRRKGLCVACGYDIRATPHRCPECGAGADIASA
jgi:hypothetical protein